MDLGAYEQIEELNDIALSNNIDVPRLRGYRLMEEEHKINYLDMFDGIDIECVKYLCEARPVWSSNPEYLIIDRYTDYLRHFFIKFDKIENETIKVRWNRIHGWKRKRLKLAIHNKKKAIKTQYDVWNKYAGRNDILYIHARIGGGNWPYYCKEVVNQPWFIEKVDDAYDRTYCDIYAKIKPI